MNKLVFDYLWLVWAISSLSFIRFYVFVAAYLPKMIRKPLKKRFETPQMIFQITTKGKIPIVQRTIERIHRVCQSIEYYKYEVWVVTDVDEEFENCRIITVPTEFSCNAIFKGRALQYAVELRSLEKKNTESIYIFHLDDESLITEQTICGILSFIEVNPTPVSEGLIVYPIYERDKIKISNLMDTIRPFCCFECMDFMTRGNPAYIHGSNLLVRSDIEEKVGWDNGKTIAEDTLFAFMARKKIGPDIFGWHGGIIEEKSPKNLRDLFKQRRRWFYGLIQNLKYFSPKERVFQVTRAIIWFSGFVSGLVSIFALLIPQNMPDPLRIFFLIASGLWLLSYQIGAYFNGKFLSPFKRLKYHILTLVSSPILGLIESSIPALSLLRKPQTFEVIEK